MPQLQETKKGIDVAKSKFAGLQLDDEGGNASSESDSQGEEASGDN